MDDSTITLTIGPGDGREYSVTVTVGGQSNGAPKSLFYGPPTVTSCIPNVLPAVGGEVILRGKNFQLGSGTALIKFGIYSITFCTQAYVILFFFFFEHI